MSSNPEEISMAIPTLYKGIQYKSRLEARTAIFFDFFGVKHQYEKQKYTLGNLKYIPDFWLEDYQMFVEVKGMHPTDLAREKARKLLLQEGYPVMIVSGVPYTVERELFTTPGEYDDPEDFDPQPMYDYTGEPTYSCIYYSPDMSLEPFQRIPVMVGDTYTWTIDAVWVHCAECRNLCVGVHFRRPDRNRDYYWPVAGCSRPGHHVVEIELLDYKMKQAYASIRSVRF